MGPRRRSSNPASPASASRRAGVASPPADDDAPIRAECEKAYKAIERGRTAKAQKIVKSLFSHRGQSLAVLHHIQGIIYSELANHTTDSSAKLKQLENAAESARRAAALSPNSVEFALCYSVALFDVVRKSGDRTLYQKIIEECTRGSDIENPRDPLRDTLRQDPNDSRNLTPELRIANVKEDLDSLKAKCQIMTDFELLDTPVRRSKTSEQKLEEIELSDRFTRGGEIKENNPKQEQKNLHPMRERSESLKAEQHGLSRAETDDPKLERMRSFWVTMSAGNKRAFMEVRTDELEQYVESLNSGIVKEMMEDALSLVAENNRWTCWDCGICGERYRDCQQCEEHYTNYHATKLPNALEEFVPDEIDKKRAYLLLNGDWKPVDTLAAIAMLLEDSSFRLNDDEAWSKRWPLASDPERENILKDICGMFQTLQQRRCLSPSHVRWVQTYARTALKTLLPEARLSDCGLLDSPQCICFLDSKKLIEVVTFLQRSLNPTGSQDTLEVNRDDLRIKERVGFCSESSHLILEGKSLERELNEYDGPFCDELPCDDVFLSWLLEALPADAVDEQIEFLWIGNEDRRITAMDVLKSLGKEFDQFQTTVSQKYELQFFRAALLTIETMWENEDRRRKQVLEFKSQTYAFMRNAKIMLGLLSKVMEKSSVLDIDLSDYENHSGFHDHPISVISSLSDQFETIRDENRIRDNFTRLYDFVEVACIFLGLSASKITSRYDAIILHTFERMRKMKGNLLLLWWNDYRSIIVPLMKSFMRERLELMISKASTESPANPIEQVHRLDPKPELEVDQPRIEENP